MTNWLDAAEVRATQDPALRGFSICDCRVVACPCCYVLEAIAELPEPKANCDYCHGPQASDIHKTDNPVFGYMGHEFVPSTLHRIWTVARIVCGKEEGREG